METGWILLISVAVLGVIGVLARLALQTWVKTLVEKSVTSKFEKELEAVRSDLRVKEGKITALQGSVLSGRAGRQAILDKRRIEAVENLWREVNKLNAFLWPTRVMEVLKIDEIDSRAQFDPNIR